MIIGLTGPIAAGKSTVAKILARRGFYIIDADKIGHEVYEPQTPGWRDLVKAFGIKILSYGGRINRRKLSEIVFSDPKALKTLNRITHPLIRDRIRQEIRKQKAESRKLIVVNAALLKEIGLIPLVNEVWVVRASREKRLKRLMRKGLSMTQANARLKVLTAKPFLKMADRVITNDSTIKKLKQRVINILKGG